MNILRTSLVTSLLLLAVGCGSSGSNNTSSSDDNSIVDENTSTETENQNELKSVRFLALYNPSDPEEKKSLRVLSVDSNNNLSSEVVEENFYPHNRYGGSPDFLSNVDVYADTYVMALHEDFNVDSDFRYQGAVGSLSEKTYKLLSLVPPSEDSDYAYFKAGTGRVSANGNDVFYISSTDDKNYGDEPRSYYMRYNKKTDTTQRAISCESFILNQPEKGEDTETCDIKGYYIPSEDGRYIYSYMSGYGLDFNTYHTDYTILFQYDFDNETYTRLGEEEDKDVLLLSATSDRKNIIYKSNAEVKVLNVETGTIKVVENITDNPEIFLPSLWNQYGVLRSSTVQLYFNDYVHDKVTVIVPKRVTNEQFSEDGTFVYFRLYDDEERTLYKTKDLSENSPYEAVTKIPKEYGNILLIKGDTSSSSSTINEDSNSLKSCIEDEGSDVKVYWRTCYDSFPESECNQEGLGSVADSDYTQTYKVITGSCLESGLFTEDDTYFNKDYKSNSYNTFIIFP